MTATESAQLGGYRGLSLRGTEVQPLLHSTVSPGLGPAMLMKEARFFLFAKGSQGIGSSPAHKTTPLASFWKEMVQQTLR